MGTVIKQPLLPDEIGSAISTVRSSFCAAAPHRAIWTRYLAFYLSMFGAGCWIGYVLQSLFIISDNSGEFWRACLTVLAVLSGFMIATMSFTGKAEVAKSLTLDQLCSFTEKSNHLLFSQLLMLCNHIASSLIIGLIILTQSSGYFFTSSLITLAFGALICSIVRSLLVPIQIVELHRFAHRALIEEKKAEANKSTEDI